MTRSAFQMKMGLAAAALATLPTAAAMAQFEDNPLFQPIMIRPIHGHAFVEGEYQTDSRTRNEQTTTTTNLYFQEGIQLNTGGWIYHPNLFDWNGLLRLGLNQQQTEFRGEERSSDGVLLGYHLDGIALRRKPLSLHVFSSYSQNRTTRDFAVPLDFENTRNGLEVIHRGLLDTTLLFEHTTSQESSDVRDRDEEVFRGRLQSQYRHEDVELDLRYEHESIEETLRSAAGSTDFPTEVDEVSLRNVFFFGDGPQRHLLAGQTRFTDRRGFFETQTFSANQRLTLQHSPTLSTFYGGSFRQTTSEGLDEQTLLADLGFNKRFYESLDLSGRLFAEMEEFSGGREQRLGGELNALYRKTIPIGTYHSSLRLGRTYEKEESEEGERRVIAEAITLTGTNFVPLSEINVIPGSIVVTSADRTITFVEGIHYNVRVTGLITEIQRIEFAPDPIADGEVVLVDYSTSLSRDAEFVGDRVIWSHRVEIDALHLAPFVILEYFDESLLGGEDPGNLEHMTSVTLGVDYAHQGFFAGYEFQTLDSLRNLSFDAHRVRARYDRILGRDLSLSVGGDAEWLVYTNAEEFGLEADEDFRTTYHAFGQLTQRLSRNALWRLRTDWRDISGRQNTMNAEVSSGLEWRWRQLELSVDGRYRFFSQEETDGEVAGAMFQLRRYF